MNEIKCCINGVDYPIVFTMGTMLRFKRLTGKDVSQMSQTDIEDSAALIYCAVASGAKSYGIDFPYDFDQFYDCLPIDEFAKLSEAIISQFNVPTTTATTKKKKTTK